MKLREIALALRAAGDLARTGERILQSLDATRRLTTWPVLLGVGMGVGLGALLFSDEARARAKKWLRPSQPSPITPSNGEASVQPRPS